MDITHDGNATVNRCKTNLKKVFYNKKWPGAKPLPLLVAITIGLIIKFAIPKPKEVQPRAWSLLAFFVTTICGLVYTPLPTAAWTIICMTAVLLTKTLSFSEGFFFVANDTMWLIIIAFFFSRGFVKTGLGERVAAYFIKWLGRKTIGLSYGFVFGEMVLCPGIPSTTARGGGIFIPIIVSVSRASGSLPHDKATSKKLGAFLIMSQLQAAGNSSALFLTAAAQNPICLQLAEGLGVKLGNQWVSWLKYACVPALVGLFITPLVLYKIYPPGIKDTPDAPFIAAEKLKNMGPVTRNELVMLATMLLAVALWVCGSWIHVSSVVAAMIGLSVLLLLGVLDWEDCLNEKSAWDTLAWFAILVGMAEQLSKLHLISWISNCVHTSMQGMNLSWPAAFFILQLIYFFSHYLFASQTGHVASLFSAFLGMQIAAGVPGLLATLALGYSTNLFGALTHYGSGSAAVYYGAGYVELPDLFKMGIVIAIVNIVIWIIFGGIWWKILGLY